MKVILRQSVENLGGPGEVVSVKDGYARNFLIPKRLAMPHTPGNLKIIDREKRQLAVKEARIKSEAEALAERFAGTALTFTKKAGEEGVLYGSVTPAEISDGLAKKGLEVDKRRLIIPETIKRVGESHISIRLHPEVELSVMITVIPEGEEGGTPEAGAEEPMQEIVAEVEEDEHDSAGSAGEREVTAESPEESESAETEAEARD